MGLIQSFYIFVIGLLFINTVYSRTQTVYEINVIPVGKNIFEAGISNQIRISLWSKTRNYPVSLEEIEPVENSLIDVVVFSKDLRAFSQFHMEDFPHYNNETNLPTTANYFDIDYVFPIAGEYTISIKCKPYKKNVRVNQNIHVEGKKDSKMNVDSSLLPSNPNKQKVVYFKPIQLENVKSIYYLPIIPHTLSIPEKDLKAEISKATGPIYGTKISIKNTLRSGYCSNVILEFFRIELKGDKIKETPVKDLFQYNNVPIKAILANQENQDFDIIQGNILDTVSDNFPSCGNKIEPPTEMVYGPIFGFSVPFRKIGLYHVIFEIAHSYNDNTYLLTPDIALRVAEEGEEIKYAPQDYIDDDTNYDQFIKDVIEKQNSIPDAAVDNGNDANEDNEDNKNADDDKTDDKNDENKIDDDDNTNENKTDDDDKTDENKTDDDGKTDDDKTNDDGKTDDSKTDEDKADEDVMEEKSTILSAKTTTTITTTITITSTTTTKSSEENEDKTTTTIESSETIPTDPDDKEIPESAHGKIIIIGVAGIITVSGLMFYKQKSSYRNVETIPSEYKQINPDNDDDDDDDSVLNNVGKEMIEKRSNVSLTIEDDELLDTEDYTLMENDD